MQTVKDGDICHSEFRGLNKEVQPYKTYMQFLAAKSRCTNFFSAKYSIPMATSLQNFNSFQYSKDLWFNTCVKITKNTMLFTYG